MPPVNATAHEGLDSAESPDIRADRSEIRLEPRNQGPGRRPLQETPADMKVVYTDEALENLAGILNYLASHYPAIYEAFQIRLAFGSCP